MSEVDLLQKASVPTCGIGKIGDLFATRGLDQCLPTRDNSEGMQILHNVLMQQKNGLIFVNLVDFDMLYGHRLDPQGFATALQEFDQLLPRLFHQLSVDDLLLIVADHGCDPTTPGTDHCREYVPLLARSQRSEKGRSLGTRKSFADISATLAEIFSIDDVSGKSFLPILKS